MPGRQYGSMGRYGFNGKEQDPEVKGSGAQYDYGFRIYDPKVVRFLSVDPLQKQFPFYTPYQFAGNSPIANLDLDGREDIWFMAWFIKTIVTEKLKTSNAGESFASSVRQANAGPTNYGRIDQSKDIQQQIDANNINAYKAKVEMIRKTVNAETKAYVVGAALAASPAIAAALPELFVAAGSSNLTHAGSYLVQHTVSAMINAGSQKVVTGEVDWLDIAADYLPVKATWAKTAIKGLQASTDYTVDRGLKSIFGWDTNSKYLTDAAIDALVPEISKRLFGRYNKALEKAFNDKGLEGDKLIKVMGEIIKAQSEYIQGMLKTAAAEEAKKRANAQSNE